VGVALIIFVGGMGGSPPEEMVAHARRAIARDTIERALATGVFEQVIVVTDMEQLERELSGRAIVEQSEGPFHFGERLRDVIRRYRVEKPLYIGGGAAPLLSSEELGAIARELSVAENTVITNNIFSADLIAFTPGQAIEAIEPPSTDNPLAQLLAHQAGLKEVCLPRTAATQFDVDTPTDLLVLGLHPAAGPLTRAYLASLNLDISDLRGAMSFFTNPMAEVLVAGRVGSYVWSRLERDTACRIRALSEERGMCADGRAGRGEVRSILGFYLEEVGPARFFQSISQLGNAAFIDTRVIFDHLGLDVSRRDRFFSDLGRPGEIGNTFVREFTKAAIVAPIPVILGGHSLVSGGLLTLIEVAWLEHDRKGNY